MLKIFLFQSLFYFSILINFNCAFALSAQDKHAIEKTIQDYTYAWNEKACKGFADDFSENADFVNIFGMHFSGKSEIESRHIAILQSFLKDSKLKIMRVGLREIKPGFVIAHVRWQLNGYRDPGSDLNQPGETREGIYTQIFLNEGDKWSITASQNTLSLK